MGMASSTPTSQSGVAKATLMALWGGSATPDGQSKFFLKKKIGLALGVAGPPQGPHKKKKKYYFIILLFLKKY
jgi:hypothetical protein